LADPPADLPPHQPRQHPRAGLKVEGTIMMAFDMTVLNDLDRFHLAMDAVDRLPQTGDKGLALTRRLLAKLLEDAQYIRRHGRDLPEIRDWKWPTAR